MSYNGKRAKSRIYDKDSTSVIQLCSFSGPPLKNWDVVQSAGREGWDRSISPIPLPLKTQALLLSLHSVVL